MPCIGQPYQKHGHQDHQGQAQQGPETDEGGSERREDCVQKLVCAAAVNPVQLQQREQGEQRAAHHARGQGWICQIGAQHGGHIAGGAGGEQRPVHREACQWGEQCESQYHKHDPAAQKPPQLQKKQMRCSHNGSPCAMR